MRVCIYVITQNLPKLTLIIELSFGESMCGFPVFAIQQKRKREKKKTYYSI